MSKTANISAQFSAQIDSVKANKDRTLMIKFETQELTPEETAVIFGFMELQVWVALAETPMTTANLKIPDVMPEFPNEKSPSETMRAIIYRIWERTKKLRPFPDYYKS